MQNWCEIVTALGASYAVSVIVGGLVVGSFHRWRKSKLDKVPIEHKRANPHITGFIEALVFTPLVLARPGDAVVAMGGWLALKMAATWQKDFPTVAHDDVGKLKEILDWQSHSFQALGRVDKF